MKVICEGVELSDAVMKVSKACSTKTTTPILESIRISAENDSVMLLATDGEIAIRKKIRAEVLEEGAICVPGKYFSDFIKKLENVVLALCVSLLCIAIINQFASFEKHSGLLILFSGIGVYNGHCPQAWLCGLQAAVGLWRGYGCLSGP